MRSVSHRKRAQLLRLTWALIIAMALTLIAHGLVAEKTTAKISPMWVVGTLCGLCLVTFWVARQSIPRLGPLLVYGWGGAALLLLSLEVTWKPNPVSASSYVRDEWSVMEDVASELYVLDPEKQYRVVFGGDFQAQFASMMASYHGVRSLAAYFNPMPNSQFRGLYYHGRVNDNYYQGLGVKYLVCQRCTDKETAGLELLIQHPKFTIYAHDAALSKTYVTSRVLGEFHSQADFRVKLDLQELTHSPLYLRPSDFLLLGEELLDVDSICKKEILSFRSNELYFVTHCDKPALLVINDYFDGNWLGSLNDQPRQPIEVNANQIGMYVPAGSSRVRLTYRPRNLQLSWYIAGVGLLFLLSTAFMPLASRQRPQVERKADELSKFSLF